MRIAILGSFPIYPYRDRVRFWDDRPSLTSTWNLNLARALAKRDDCEVHVLTNAPLLVTKSIETEGFHLHFVGHLPKVNYWDYLTRFRYSKMNFDQLLARIAPDVVHGSGTDHEYAYIAAGSRFPNIFTVHYVMKDLIIEDNEPWWSMYSLFAKYEQKVLRRSRFGIAVSGHVIRRFPEFEGRFFKIPNTVAPEYFDVAPRDKRGDLIFVGRIIEHKRVLNLLKAVYELKQQGRTVSLRVVGEGRDAAYFRKLTRFVSDRGLAEQVRFDGRMEPEELAKAMAESRLLVLPSIGESFSMVCAEAQAVGTPVVASNIGGPDEVVLDGETGCLVTPDDVTELTNAIEKLLSDRELRQQMGRRGRERAQEFRPGRVAKATYDAYTEVLQGSTSL